MADTRHPRGPRVTAAGPFQPSLPYNGGTSSGHAYGSPTSTRAMPARTRAQQPVYEYVGGRGAWGATSPEVEDALDRGHGSVSGALSALHTAGWLARLTLTRPHRGGDHAVYVLPEYVNGRATEPSAAQRRAGAQ